MRAQCRLWSMPALKRTASCTSVCPAPPSKTSRSVGTHTNAPICSGCVLWAQWNYLLWLLLDFMSKVCLKLCPVQFISRAETCCSRVWQVQIRPWNLNDSDFVMDGSQPLDPRKTIFVGGVPRPLRAGIPHFCVNLFIEDLMRVCDDRTNI